MAKTIYSFYYYTDTYELTINRKKIEITFRDDSGAGVYINRISLQYNINLGELGLIELLDNGDYLTHDGLRVSINPTTYQVLITFLEDNSYLLSYGDSSIDFVNNGYLNFFEDDRDLELRPNIWTKPFFDVSFNDSFKITDINKFKKQDSESPINFSATFDMDLIVFTEESFIGEFIGINNRYDILIDSRDKEILSPLIPDYSRNNLDSLFYNP